MIVKSKNAVINYIYKDTSKNQMKFDDASYRKDLSIEKSKIKRFGKDLMIFVEGRWKHVLVDEALKILKRDIVKVEKKLIYTDTQFNRIIDVIDSEIEDFADKNLIYNVNIDEYYKVIAEDYIYKIKYNYDNNTISIKKEINNGQYFNFVSLPKFDIDLKSDEFLKNDSHLVSVDDIDTFLMQISCNDESWIKYIQEVAGYSMLNGHMEPHIYIGLGKGSNGKSVLASMLKRILGIRNVMANEFADLNPQTMAQLESNYLNLPTELSGSKMLPENLLKAIADGEFVTINEKYKEPRTITPIAKQFAMANELPPIKDASDGFWRRARVIPFDLKISTTNKSKKGKTYFEDLFKNNEELLRKWAFKGLIRLIKNKGIHIDCNRIIDASKKYQLENNIVLLFLEEIVDRKLLEYLDDKMGIMNKQKIILKEYETNLEVMISGNGEWSIDLNSLFLFYQSWSILNGYKPQSIKNFKKKLEEKTDHFWYEFELKNSDGKHKIFFIEAQLWHYKQKLIKENKLELKEIPVEFETIKKDINEIILEDDVVDLDHLKKIKYNLKEEALIAVEKNGLELEYVIDNLKDDKDIVLAAIKNKGWSLKYASDNLKDDKDIFIETLKSDKFAIKFASNNLQNQYKINPQSFLNNIIHTSIYNDNEL